MVKPVVAWNAAGTRGRALYFTRAPAPLGATAPLFHHVGIACSSRASAGAASGRCCLRPLERREKLEQLRALEAGMHIEIARTERGAA